ncbi:hypothetical protein RintRC_1139 [Richelia intracellularis]|nr:hypothetical protein RintRC_1139 [Richelia intracellularis]
MYRHIAIAIRHLLRSIAASALGVILVPMGCYLAKYICR